MVFGMDGLVGLPGLYPCFHQILLSMPFTIMVDGMILDLCLGWADSAQPLKLCHYSRSDPEPGGGGIKNGCIFINCVIA